MIQGRQLLHFLFNLANLYIMNFALKHALDLLLKKIIDDQVNMYSYDAE